MTDLNLDELSAARSEAGGKIERKTITFKKKKFNAPAEFPMAALDFQLKGKTATLGELTRTMRAIFGEQYEDFIALGPSTTDAVSIVREIGTLYGVSAGKSTASSGSSKTTGARSRRTSKRTTK